MDNSLDLLGWHLVLHHDSYDGYFRTITKAKKSNERGLFSALGNIDDRYKINGRFYFRIVYPQINGYIQFSQKINPMQATMNDDVNCSIEHQPYSRTFQCLVQSNLDFTFLEGEKDDVNFWCYAIGMLKSTNDEFAGLIPGPQWIVDGTKIHVVDLYIKISDEMLIRQLYSQCSKHQKCICLDASILKFAQYILFIS